MRLPIIVDINPGPKNIRKATTKIINNTKHNLFLNPGPINWFNNLKGFKLHSNLPDGAGKNGS